MEIPRKRGVTPSVLSSSPEPRPVPTPISGPTQDVHCACLVFHYDLGRRSLPDRSFSSVGLVSAPPLSHEHTPLTTVESSRSDTERPTLGPSDVHYLRGTPSTPPDSSHRGGDVDLPGPSRNSVPHSLVSTQIFPVTPQPHLPELPSSNLPPRHRYNSKGLVKSQKYVLPGLHEKRSRT